MYTWCTSDGKLGEVGDGAPRVGGWLTAHTGRHVGAKLRREAGEWLSEPSCQVALTARLPRRPAPHAHRTRNPHVTSLWARASCQHPSAGVTGFDVRASRDCLCMQLPAPLAVTGPSRCPPTGQVSCLTLMSMPTVCVTCHPQVSVFLLLRNVKDIIISLRSLKNAKTVAFLPFQAVLVFCSVKMLV